MDIPAAAVSCSMASLITGAATDLLSAATPFIADQAPRHPIAVTAKIHLEKQLLPKKLVYRPLFTETEFRQRPVGFPFTISTL